MFLNNNLYIVNGGGAGVTQLGSTENWQTAAIIKVNEGPYKGATTNVAVNNQIYRLNTRVDPPVTEKTSVFKGLNNKTT